MEASSTPAKDHLEVREMEDARFGIYDTLTDKFVSSRYRRRADAEAKLDTARQHRRPIIVRWVFGMPTQESKRLGVTD